MFRDESDCRLFQHSRELEAIISGYTKTGKADKSPTFEIMGEEQFCELGIQSSSFILRNIPASRLRSTLSGLP
jgi:hypothetical protein